MEKKVDFSDEHNDHVTVTVDGVSYKMSLSKKTNPSDGEILKYIRVTEYPDMPVRVQMSGIEAIETWVKDGAKIPAVLDTEEKEIEPEKVAEKIAWTNKHPGKTDSEKIIELEVRIAKLEGVQEK